MLPKGSGTIRPSRTGLSTTEPPAILINSLLINSHNEYGNRLVKHLKGSGTNRAFANLCGTGPGDSGCSGGPNDVAADTWAHLVYTSKMDGSTRTDKFYVHGALTVTKTHGSILNAHQALKFGQARGNPYLSGHQQFHAELNQLEIWSHALNDAEVSELRAACCRSGRLDTRTIQLDADVNHRPCRDHTVEAKHVTRTGRW